MHQVIMTLKFEEEPKIRYRTQNPPLDITASLSHLRTMLPESSSRPLPAKAAQSGNLVLISLEIPVQSSLRIRLLALIYEPMMIHHNLAYTASPLSGLLEDCHVLTDGMFIVETHSFFRVPRLLSD